MNYTVFFRRIRESRLFWVLTAWAVILGFNALFIPEFFRINIQDGHLYGNLIDVLNNGAPLMLVALGMTLVIATGGVDLSVGAVMAISAAMGAVLINPAPGDKLVSNEILTRNATNTPLAIIVLATLAAGTLCGLWNGLLVSIITIYYTPYFWFGNGYILGLPVSIYIVTAVAIIAWVGVRKTPIGLFIEAVGINPKATYYSGISAKNVQLLAYTFSGFCSALAGLILSSYVHSADGNNNGLNYELDAILAVVMGGTMLSGGRFSLLASVLSAMVIWTFTLSMYTLGVPANALLAGRAVLVLLVILLYSDRRLVKRRSVRADTQPKSAVITPDENRDLPRP